jgi:hypothetical protein
MSIKELNIETVFSGSIHLLWLTLFTLILLGRSPDILFSYLSEIQSGTAVFLVAVFFSLSFFFGRVAEHVLIAFNYYCRKGEIGKTKMIISFAGDPVEAWGNKIFSINSFAGLILLVTVMLTLSVINETFNLILPIILIGVPLSLATLVSYCYWQNLEKKLTSYRINRIRQAKKLIGNDKLARKC